MLWTSFVMLLFFWLVGVTTSVTLSGLIHLLPVVAVLVAVAGTFQNRQLAK